MRLFISYAHVDKRIVKDWIVDNLHAGGHEVWIDFQLLAGQPWRPQLEAAIAKSDVFIYAVTPESLASVECQREVQVAQYLEKPILPVLLRDRTPMPDWLGNIQYVDFSDGPTSHAVAKLIGALPQLTIADNTTSPPGTSEDKPALTSPGETKSPTTASTLLPLVVVPIIIIGVVIVFIVSNLTPTPPPSNGVTPLASEVSSISTPLTPLGVGQSATTVQPATEPATSATANVALSPIPTTINTAQPTSSGDADASSSYRIEPINGFDYAFVPAGMFLGNDVPAFWIMVFEVTNAQFAAFLESRGSLISAEGKSRYGSSSSGSRIDLVGDKWQAEAGYENHPAVRVTWYGARDFCNSIGARLPIGPEWHKAAAWNPSTGEVTTYPWGTQTPDETVANFNQSVSTNTAPIDAYPHGRSPVGAYNMAGNAAEWTQDTQGIHRFLRGGSWENTADALHADVITQSIDTFNSASSGFRCVVDDR